MSGVAGQIIAQQIGMKAAIQVVILDPDHISSGFGELLVIDLEHAAGHHRRWQGVSCPLKHGRPEDAVVVDDIAAYKMNDFGAILPVALPIPAIL